MKQEVICEKSRHLILLVPFGTLHSVSSRELRRTFDPQSADFYYGRGCLLENDPFQVRLPGYHSRNSPYLSLPVSFPQREFADLLPLHPHVSSLFLINF